MSDAEGKLIAKDYSHFSDKKLNKILKLRNRQIASAEADHATTHKSLAQLKYERDTILTTIMERAMTENT